MCAKDKDDRNRWLAATLNMKVQKEFSWNWFWVYSNTVVLINISSREKEEWQNILSRAVFKVSIFLFEFFKICE